MPRGLRRLPFFPRRGASDGSASDGPVVDNAGIDPDDAPVGPPVLLPAMIYRQVLVDATDVVPVWARPRPAASTIGQDVPDPAAHTDEPPATKSTRRRKASGSSSEPKTPAPPRSPRKPTGSRRRSQ